MPRCMRAAARADDDSAWRNMMSVVCDGVRRSAEWSNISGVLMGVCSRWHSKVTVRQLLRIRVQVQLGSLSRTRRAQIGLSHCEPNWAMILLLTQTHCLPPTLTSGMGRKFFLSIPARSYTLRTTATDIMAEKTDFAALKSAGYAHSQVERPKR